ncbi:MAG: hypothetical protein ACW964_17750 [Candidatus Hodarchaeales archaeon]
MNAYQKPDIKTNFSNVPTWLYLVVVIILYAFGAFSLFDLASTNTELVDSITVALEALIPISLPFIPLLIAFVAIFLVITFILAYVIVWIMSKVAQEVTMIVSVVFPIIMIGLGGLLATGGLVGSSTEDSSALLFFGLILAGLGLLFLAIVIWKFRTIKRSGQFVEFSAQLVLDEKAVLLMPIFLGLFTTVTGFFMLFGFIEILNIFSVVNSSGDTELSPVGIISSIIFEYIYLIVFFGIYYSLSAGVISYASDWYRGLDPDLNSAMKDVKQVFPIILKFAFAMATVKIIMSILTGGDRRGRSTTSGQRGSAGAVMAGVVFAALAGIVISILGAIWMFMNYFTLVSIVQNKKGLKDSIKDSAKTTWNSLLDVLIGESGFGLTMFIFWFVNEILWIVVGFTIGFAITQELSIGIILSVIFLILGFMPYQVVTMPMQVAFRTFLYSYAKDTIEGYKKPSRLPQELREDFSTLSKRDVKRRGMRDPTKYF